MKCIFLSLTFLTMLSTTFLSSLKFPLASVKLGFLTRLLLIEAGVPGFSLLALSYTELLIVEVYSL